MKKRYKKKSKSSCNSFDDFTLPPCAKFLGSINPLIKDGKVIYRNLNRFYFFISYHYSKISSPTYNPLNPQSFNDTITANLQIEPYYFFIGMYINEIQKGNILYNDNVKIHDNKYADSFIKTILKNNYEINSSFIPSLTYAISNSNAIIAPYLASIEISLINFYIILMINRFYYEYGLLFSDNAYVTNDFINNFLANIYVEFNNY
ncbi:MAG: hypothetical protein MSA89_00270 [Clostridium sp.]|nr:hypothetical protein [Clostridium sp.]